MEKLAQPQTLEKPSRSFHPYSRPIRSRTTNTLALLLSNFHTLSPHSIVQQGDNDVQVRQGCDSSNATSCVEVIQISDGNVTRNNDLANSIVELNDRPLNKDLGGDELIKSPESNQINLVTDKTDVENCICVAEVLMDDEKASDCGLDIVKELNGVDGVLEIEMGEFEFNKDFSLDDFSDVLNFSFDDDDMDVGSSKADGDAVSTLPENVSDRVRLKEMELEKLLASPSMTDALGCVSGDVDVEEGEISGGTNDCLDGMSEDEVSLGDNKSAGLLHATEVNVDKDSNSSAIKTSNNNGDSNTEKCIKITTEVNVSESQNLIYEGDKETNKLTPVASSLQNVSSFGRNLEEIDAENQVSAATMQDTNTKKRKKGPLTKEKKAKKKKKERIKRAEKNRELGVKRLKLPSPVLKPKTVKHCRHYLHGRCHEGEKCKFSHDVVPLTKSKPCGHFARQSCMKGDDCPFDHDLSKYPCNNYASNSFCGRGSDCLFSHEISASQSSPMTPNVSKPEKRGPAVIDDLEPYVKLARPMNNLNSVKTDSCGIFPKKMDGAKLKSGGDSSGKKVEQVLESVKIAKKTPKGVSFILHGGVPAGDPNKQRDVLSPASGGYTDVQKMPLDGPLCANKANEVSVVEARSKPRGINFLSFTQTTSLDDASCKTLSNLFSSGYDGKEKQSRVSSEGGIIGESCTQVSKKVTGLSEERPSNISLVTVPLPVNSSTTGNTQLYDSANAKICSSLKTSPLSNTSLVQKAVQSTLAFAAKFESSIKPGHS